MRIAIDVVGAKETGGAVVAQAVTAAMLAEPRIEIATVFCSPRAVRAFALPEDPRLRQVEVALGERGRLGRAMWQYGTLPRAIRRCGASVAVMLSGGGVAPPGVAGVFLLQQSLPFVKEGSRRFSVAGRVHLGVLGASIMFSARRAHAVVVQTRGMEALFRARLGGVARPPEVWLCEPDAVMCAASCGAVELDRLRASAEGGRFLYVGTAHAHKNIEVLDAGAQAVLSRAPAARVFATLTSDEVQSAGGRIVPLGRLRRDVLAEAYSLATAVIMPSLAETVGLPMLEAFAAGTPVVAADRSYAREVCGDAALYFDPLNAYDLAEQLLRVSVDDACRRSLIRRGYRRAEQRRKKQPYPRLVRDVVRLGSGA